MYLNQLRDKYKFTEEQLEDIKSFAGRVAITFSGESLLHAGTKVVVIDNKISFSADMYLLSAVISEGCTNAPGDPNQLELFNEEHATDATIQGTTESL